MSNETATEYENVKNKIQQMENYLENIESTIEKINTAIQETTEWKGPDADIYKILLKKYTQRIKNNSRWLKNLDKIISNHAYSLHQRALNDQKAKSFR